MTKNFKLSEFECNCGCVMPDEVKSNIIKLAGQLQTLRDIIDKPIRITNAYRCLSHNRSIGSKDTSQHILGKAADIKVSGYKPEVLAKFIDEMIYGGHLLQGGLAAYNTFVHYDIRKTKARWGKTLS